MRGSRVAAIVAHNADLPYYDLECYPIIWLTPIMTSGRYEIDSHGRRHFRPNIPRLPRLEDTIDILSPATEALREFDRRLAEFGMTGMSGRLFARLDAVHSSGAEGSTTTFTELMDFSARAVTVPSIVEAEEIAALAEAVDDMAMRPMDLVDVILHLHRRLFEKAPDRFKSESAGQFKTHANATFDDTQPDGGFRYTLPASLPAALSEWHTFSVETLPTVPELVRQACSHWMFEHIHPLQDGNGRVGRLLVPLLIRWKGVTEMASAFIGEAVHEHKDHYIEGLKAARITNDMTPFARIFLSFIKQNATANISRLDRIGKLHAEWQKASTSIRRDSAVHRLRVWIIGHPVFTVGQAARELNIGFATANEAVRKLVNLGIAMPANSVGRNRIFRVPAILDIFDRFRKPAS